MTAAVILSTLFWRESRSLIYFLESLTYIDCDKSHIWQITRNLYKSSFAFDKKILIRNMKFIIKYAGAYIQPLKSQAKLQQMTLL